MLIAHDYMEQTDGGSRLCLELAKHMKASLLCGFVRRGHPFLHGDAPDIRTLCDIAALPIPLWRQWLLAIAFRHLHLMEDHILYSGTYAPLAVRGQHHGKAVLYCHTPPRFLYDDYDTFSALAPVPLKPLFRAFCDWLRPLYAAAVARMDVVIANSYEVQSRIRRLLGRKSVVIPPPCNTQNYFWKPSEGYFLSMVRLDALKRIDLLVKAFRKLPHKKLVVLSDGPEGARLRKASVDCPNIVWTGVQSEAARHDLLARCAATICVARNEDFGMCAVESLAAGKPVIIAGSGGLKEIIRHGETGMVLSADPSPEEIRIAVTSCDSVSVTQMRPACQREARRYDTRRFSEKMQKVIYD